MILYKLISSHNLQENYWRQLKGKAGASGIYAHWGRLLTRSQMLRPEIIMQKLPYLQYSLTNSLSIWLASSYILN